jgi:hypothetical protein
MLTIYRLIVTCKSCIMAAIHGRSLHVTNQTSQRTASTVLWGITAGVVTAACLWPWQTLRADVQTLHTEVDAYEPRIVRCEEALPTIEALRVDLRVRLVRIEDKLDDLDKYIREHPYQELSHE